MQKPIRINDTLVAEAELHGALEHRSAPKQLEYWANLGKLVAAKLKPEDSLALLQGFMDVRLVESDPADFDMDDILSSLETDRSTGTLANAVSESAFRYGIDPDNPTQLVRMDRKGTHKINEKTLLEHGAS